MGRRRVDARSRRRRAGEIDHATLELEGRAGKFAATIFGGCDALAVNDSMAIARARDDLEVGRAWKARDRLTGLLTHRQDFEVLDLLATVHHEMQDLPAAGALWFVTGRDDEAARSSIAAWRERYGSDEDRWRSIPGPIRRKTRADNLSSLQEAARQRAGGFARSQPGDYEESWWEPIVFGGGVIALLVWLVAMIVIGMWTVVGWIWN